MDGVFKIGDVEVGKGVLIAPMAGVTDLPFRRTASKLGASYTVSEMVACETLALGRPDMVRRAAVGDGLPPERIPEKCEAVFRSEHAPMVIQLAGSEPEWIAKGAEIAEAAGADIIDINMGCPTR